MGRLQNSKPRTYRETRSKFQQRVIKALLNGIIDPEYMSVSFPASYTDAVDTTPFVLAPPNLFRTVLMLTFPDYLVGTYFSKGYWYLEKGELSDFIDLILSNPPTKYLNYFTFISKLRGPFYRFKRRFLDGQTSRKVETHYDVESELYAAFLDPEMLYTCAFFESDEETLEVAQQRKLRLAVERTRLNDRKASVLEIGSGWGALQRHIVKQNENWFITGLTLSKGQLDWANKENRERLTNKQNERISYLLQDYLTYDPPANDKYDAVFVIGMMEHVGQGNLGEFSTKILDFLKPDGRCLVHTIVSPESGMPSNKWIDTNIFPGGYAPSISELTKAFENASYIVDAVHVHEGLNYFMTIEKWKDNFVTSWEKQDNPNSEFFRTWFFYLSSVQNMFSEKTLRHQVVQLVARKL